VVFADCFILVCFASYHLTAYATYHILILYVPLLLIVMHVTDILLSAAAVYYIVKLGFSVKRTHS